MGVIDARSERVQSVEEVESRGGGAGFVPADRMALSPDCGFAPDGGEPPTVDEAYARLCRLVAAARAPRARPVG